jgi:hypothetical protein
LLGHSRHSPIRGIRDEKIRDFKKTLDGEWPRSRMLSGRIVRVAFFVSQVAERRFLALARQSCYHTTMIQSFKDAGAEDVFNGENTKEARKTLPISLWKIAARKLDQLDSIDLCNGQGSVAHLLNHGDTKSRRKTRVKLRVSASPW